MYGTKMKDNIEISTIMAYISNGNKELERGNTENCFRVLESGVKYAMNDENVAGLYVLYKNLGDVCMQTKQPGKALNYFGNAIDIAVQCGVDSHSLLRESVSFLQQQALHMKLQLEEIHLPPNMNSIQLYQHRMCTTCLNTGGITVRDTDHQFYCCPCYIKYYQLQVDVEPEPDTLPESLSDPEPEDEQVENSPIIYSRESLLQFRKTCMKTPCDLHQVSESQEVFKMIDTKSNVPSLNRFEQAAEKLTTAQFTAKVLDGPKPSISFETQRSLLN